MRRVVLLLLVIACNRPENTGDNRARMNPVTPPQKELPSNRAAAATPAQLRVELLEYEIRMPDTLSAGRQSLLVVNSGKVNHSLVIEGNGRKGQLSQQITRGDSVPLDLALTPGNYTFYCPVDGHRGKGMTRTVKVQ
ncbi:MAG TPA: hypothetical protein VGS96_18690 [Thermoanaerobaculia bacterium]|jgi:hypothetical protein|nr:hypothetical protein [Thermoanaerobaculia bacterium]